MRAIQGVGSAVGTRLKALLRAEGAPVAMLGAAVLMFVNRLHGAGGPLEGDAFQNLYFWIHPELALAGYDPSRTDYFASNTLHGLFSPLHWLFFGLLSLLPAVPPLVRAYLLNVLVAASLIMLLGLGVYAFVRARGLSRSAALLAASIASFTGFHLVGVREFDYFYLYSFAAVAPLFHCVLRMGEAGRDRTAWTVAAGLIVGVSLLGGGNVPLFLYVPFLFLVPVLARPWRRPDRALAAWLGSIAGSVTLGLMIAAPVLVVGLGNLRLWNRAGLNFQEFGSFDPVSLVCTLLLRDWWSLGVVHFHERDAFLGLPVIALALHGAVVTVRACADHRTRSIPSGPAAEPGLRLVLALCAVWGLLVMLCGVLPDAMQRAIGTFYTAQSIRYPHRFAMLVQLPVAYLAAVGLDAASGRGFVRMLFWGLTGTGLVAWAALVGPVDTLVRALPDARITAAQSLSLQVLAVVALALAALLPGAPCGHRPAVRRLAVAAIAAGLILAPAQLTGYGSWVVGFGLDRSAPPDRLGWSRVLGFCFDHGRTLSVAGQTFFQPPAHLASPESRVGRILDDTATMHWHGIATGHSFVGDGFADPAGHRYLTELWYRSRSRCLDLLGVRWEVVRSVRGPVVQAAYRGAPKGNPRVRPGLVWRDSGGPVAFFARRAEAIPDDADLLGRVVERPESRPGPTILISGTPGELTAAGSAGERSAPPRGVRLEHLTAGTVRCALDDGPAGWLFVSIPYHPGWVGRDVTGEPAGPVPVYRAHHAFMACPVEGGRRVVELTFTQPFRAGATAASLAVLVALVAVLLGRWRAAAPPGSGR